MICEHVARDLDAYVDRELDAAADAAVRDHIGACPACRGRVAEREALGRLIRSAPYYAASDRLRMRVAARTARSTSIRRLVTWAAAAVVVLSVGGGIALQRSAAARANALVEDAVNGHVRSLMDGRLFDVRSTDQHTVKPWFQGRIDFAPPVADLASAGFPLVGGRVDRLGGRAVAALVYQRRQHVINVFVSPASESRGPASASIRGFHVRHWTRDGMAFWAVSDVNDAELTEFVRTLQAS
jgi:anti-sigma factor RsiW